jgi:photosystem II protein PsbQ
MRRFQAVLAVVLALVSTFLVSCSSGPVIKGPLYSDAQLQQIQSYVADVQTVRDRLTTELPPLIEQGEWNEVESFIHGPLGELRVKMARLARSLAPEKTQKAALEAAKDVFGHLNQLDEAAQNRDAVKAVRNYEAALQDFDALLQYVPQS